MKKVCFQGGAVCLAIGIVLFASSRIESEENKSKTAGVKIDPDKVPVAKAVKKSSEFDEMASKKEAKKPPSLSPKDKAATIKRVRRLAGVEKKNLKAVPPAMIQLSPDNIRQGKSWLGMLKGAIRPGLSEQDSSYMTIGPHEGVFLLHFEPMMSGSPYLLDCEVAAFPKGRKVVWEVHGAFNGIVEDQDGHLLIGFIADDKAAKLTISRAKGLVLGHLFKCELTRVD
jgi:hypothetical protein